MRVNPNLNPGLTSSLRALSPLGVIIFPAIDIHKGRSVRLLQGRADRETVYFNRPADAAKVWLEAGTTWVHVVDLDGAFSGISTHLHHVEEIASLGLKVQLGGGLRDFPSVRNAFAAGVARVVIGSRACTDPDFVGALVEEFGDRIAVGIDAKDGLVAVEGWVHTSGVDALELAGRVCQLGVCTIIYTDIRSDGMMTGPNLEAQGVMLKNCSADLIASGGVARMEDLAALANLGKNHSNFLGVITGRALYEGKLDLGQALRRFDHG